MVVEPACFHRQPDALYGVEIGRIGRQIHRLPVVPIDRFAFVPCGIVHWMALQRVAVSLEPTRETCLSSSMVAFSRWAMSKGRAINLNMAHRSVKV